MSIKIDQTYEGYFDGSTKSNPGYSGIGYCIKPGNKTRNIIKNSLFIGYRTSNVAEFVAMILMMGDAYINGITNIKIFGDSALVINSMTHKKRIQSSYLIPCF